MGHKGVSKRKPKQTIAKSTQVSKDNPERNPEPEARSEEKQPAQVTEKGKTYPSTRSKKDNKKR